MKIISTNWSKKLIHQSIWRFRRVTWQFRSLPDFLIIGAQKSGTSSLYSYLSQHPQLTPSFSQEVHFFDGGLNPDVDNFNKGKAWYRSHFPLNLHTNNSHKTFEVSPLYLFNPLVPQRICELIPEIKLIAILRNPTERAISHYFHEKRMGCESLPIMEAFQQEEERLRPVLAKDDYKNDSFIHNSYKSRGLYHVQLKRYINYFPMSSILVISSEALFRHPNDVLLSIFKFIGVDSEFAVEDLNPRNVGTNRDAIDLGVYEYLEDYFRPHNQELYELIGQKFGW